MNRLNDIQLKNIISPSINHDENVKALCAAIDAKLHEIAVSTNLILLLPRLDLLPETIIDELAWQYHVDFYDYSADIAKKRALVKQAIAWHKRKGTPSAVEEVCAAVFKTAKVSEWFEYSGQPYHFKVRLIEEAVPNTRVIDSLLRAIKVTKNTRSWLDELSFHRQVESHLYVGSMLTNKKTVDIYPTKFVPHDAIGKHYIGAGTYYHRKVVINNG